MKFLHIIFKPRHFLVILCAGFSIFAHAQSDLASPYSIYGIGRLFPSQTVMQAGMGGSGIALIDPYEVNLLNPAVSAYQLQPVFEINGVGAMTTYSQSDVNVTARSFQINNISLNFPIRRNMWGLSAGLTPYSTVGYDVTATGEIEGSTERLLTRYYGNGGLSKAYIGTSYKLYQHTDSLNNITALSAGANFNVFFGSISSIREAEPGDEIGVGVNIRSVDEISVKDFGGEFGLHFQTNIIPKKEKDPSYLKLLVGSSFSMGRDLSAKFSSITYTYRLSSFSTDGIPKDTIAMTDPVKGTIHLPHRLHFGVGLDYVTNAKQRWRLALDYVTQNWSEYSQSVSGFTSTVPEYVDSKSFHAGVELVPDVNSTEYMERVNYRLGYRTSQTNLKVDNEQIQDYGISFGLSFPINFRRNLTQSTFNIAGEYGKFGSEADQLIMEEYMKLYVGFTFTPHFRNVWFVKPKYD